MFGQKPLIKDKLYLEKHAKVDGNVLVSDFDLTDFAKCLAMNDCITKESENAGTSFCNWIYYHAMKYVQANSLMTKVQFIHIPVLRNVSDFGKLVTDIHQALSYMETRRFEIGEF